MLLLCGVFARTSRVDEQLMSPDITNDGEFNVSEMLHSCQAPVMMIMIMIIATKSNVFAEKGANN